MSPIEPTFAFVLQSHPLRAYLLTGLSLLAAAILLWALSLWLRDASIMDIFWGPGFVFASASFGLFNNSTSVVFWLALTPVALWGVRLALHIGLRARGKPEDVRYQKWRQEHGSRWWWWSFFQVFLLQVFLVWVLSFPLLYLHSPGSVSSPGLFTVVGAFVFVVGFLFEALADWQLTKFKRDPENKGKVLDQGLWYYSRHPNYFGEAVLWWGFYIMSIQMGGWWTFFCPLLMTWLLLKVSGVAMLDRVLKKSKPGYRQYILTTNAFFPGPKKRLDGNPPNES